jgi:hypothetical protein
MSAEDRKFKRWVASGGAAVTTVRGDKDWNREVAKSAKTAAKKSSKTTK